MLAAVGRLPSASILTPFPARAGTRREPAEHISCASFLHRARDPVCPWSMPQPVPCPVASDVVRSPAMRLSVKRHRPASPEPLASQKTPATRRARGRSHVLATRIPTVSKHKSKSCQKNEGAASGSAATQQPGHCHWSDRPSAFGSGARAPRCSSCMSLKLRYSLKPRGRAEDGV